MLTEITRDDYEQIQKHDVADGPLVTIIVPVFNMNPVLLRRCVLSLTGQTYRNLEILLVDDGSQLDSCIDCLHDLEREDDRIRVIWNEHGGVSRARNAGIAQARGSWIAFADADDSVWERFVERAVQLEESTRADFVIGHVFNVYKNKKITRKIFEKGYLISSEANLSSFRTAFLSLGNKKCTSYFGFYISRSPNAKMYKKSLIGNLRYDTNLTIAEDLFFTYQYLDNCSKVAVVDEDWYLYYQYAGSANRSASILSWKNSMETLFAHSNNAGNDRSAFLAHIGYMGIQGAQEQIKAGGLKEGWEDSKLLLKFACECGAFDPPSFEGFALSPSLSVIVPLCFKRHLDLACLAIFARSILVYVKNGRPYDVRENQ